MLRCTERNSEEQLKCGSAFVRRVYLHDLFMSEDAERQLPENLVIK